MKTIVVDGELRSRLHGLDAPLSFVDEGGKPVGLYLPLSEYRRWLASVEVPFSQEEIERRRAETGGGSLKEFWAKLEQQ
jgi:hypothetical protein